MKRFSRRPLVMLAIVALYWSSSVTGAAAYPVLSVVSMDKNYNDGGVYDGGNSSYSNGGDWGIFLAPGGLTGSPSYINTTDSTPSLAITLAPGNYQYSGYFVNSPAIEAGAISLYFDGSTTSDIAAFVDSTNVTGARPFSAFSGNVVASNGLGFTPGAGSLTYLDGDFAITLTQFVYYDSTQLTDANFSGVGHDVSSPPLTGAPFNAFTFSLNVADIPEPMSLLYMAPASLLLTRLRRRPKTAARG